MTVRSMQSGGKDCKTTALSPVIILSSSMLFSRRGLTATLPARGECRLMLEGRKNFGRR